jgi:hypothetical protein
MSTFATNVFVRGAAAFYVVTPSEQNTYHLTLQLCRLANNPPPQSIYIHLNPEGKWVCMDSVPDEFSFIANEIGRKISMPALTAAV